MVLVIRSLPVKAGDLRDAGLIPRSRRSPGGGNGNPLQYSCLEKPMDRGASWATVHKVTKSQTPLKRLCTYAVSLLPLFFEKLLAVLVLVPDTLGQPEDTWFLRRNFVLFTNACFFPLLKGYGFSSGHVWM